MLIRLGELSSRLGPLKVPLLMLVPFLLLYAGLGFIYTSSTGEQDALRGQVARLSGITTGALSRAQETEAKFKGMQEDLPSAELTEIEVFRTLRKLATDAGVDVEKNLTLEYKGAVAKKRVGKTNFRAMSFFMRVSGDYEVVWAIVQKLDQGETPFKTLVLDKTILAREKAVSTATVDFTIYTRAAGS